MNKRLKFTTSKEQNIWFSSDWHAYHNPINWDVPIWRQRGYNSAQKCTNDIILKINKDIKFNDILIYLGDGFLNSTPEQVESFFQRINCQNIYYLWGNHESSTSKIYKKKVLEWFWERNILFDDSLEIYPLRWQNVIFVGNYLELIINKQGIICSHFPFRIWNHVQHLSWALSGHSHYNDKERHINHQEHKALDIGWDGKLAPYSFDEIKKIMNKKSFIRIDHRDSNTN